MSGRQQVLLVGIGGQGILTAATILAEAATREGVGVVTGQLHGMSQRGGSVECTVILGDARSSFLIGAPDIVLAFEPLELLRCIHRMDGHTRALVNTTQIVPSGVEPGSSEYPPIEEIARRARETGAKVAVVDGRGLAAEAGEMRTLNVVLLGALAGEGVLPLGAEAIWKAVSRRCPPRFLESNRRAFWLGHEQTSGPESDLRAGAS